MIYYLYDRFCYDPEAEKQMRTVINNSLSGDVVDDRFLRAICEYFKIVSYHAETIAYHLSTTYKKPVTDIGSLLHVQTLSGKWEFTIGDDLYRFHGSGCTVYKADVVVCNWDFSGEDTWCCRVDPFFFVQTMRNIKEYEDIDIDRSIAECDKLVKSGALKKTADNGYLVLQAELLVKRRNIT